ncbi:hypothetical protein PV327_002871 [Microctonus hyperodae]|uniref:Uncharacterized protein n=1 Tax=Microctonus hyperodae TaxID=165561 RepID=A0AA39FGF1_MICHY|nr:hypothetical protein PV327_002871 [Microctonus hyperodae]
MLSSNIRGIFIVAALCISFSGAAPWNNDAPAAKKFFPDSFDEDRNDIDLSIFCNKNEVLRQSTDSVEPHCPLLSYDNYDEMMEYYNQKRMCMCADGYVRHPDGFCSSPQGCLMGFRSF